MKYVKYVSITIFDLNKYYHNEHIYYVINIRDLMNKFLKNKFPETINVTFISIFWMLFLKGARRDFYWMMMKLEKGYYTGFPTNDETTETT